jgi:PAS domain S-box-containing protein
MKSPNSDAARIKELEGELARARAEAAQATERLHGLAGYLREGLLLLDEDLCVSLINDQYCHLLELPLPSSQWRGVPMNTLVNMVLERVADPAGYYAELARAREFPVSQVNALLALRSGRILERDIVAVDLGTGTGWLLSCRDVTALRRGEEQLRLVSRVPEENPNPIARLDASGQTLYRNPAALRILQNMPEEARAAAQAQLQAFAAMGLAAGERQELEITIGARTFTVFVVPVVAEQYVNLYLVDVTATRLANAQRDAQRVFYETILDELPVEVVVLNDEQRYVYANPQAVPDAGQRAWLLGRTVADYCHEYHYPTALAEQRARMFGQALASPGPVVWDDCTPHPEGSRYHQRHFKLMTQAAPGRLFMLGYGLDVTARIEAEERSRRSEAAQREQQEFMQQVLDTNPSAIYVRDADGLVVFGNRAMTELVEEGRPAHELPELRAVKAREAAEYAAVDAQVRATGREVFSEDTLTLATGEVRWFQSVKCPLRRPDGTLHVLGVSTDITALKQAQHTLERSEKEYRNLMHYAQALICTYDLAGTTLSVNPALAALLGQPVAQLLGQPVVAQLLPEDQAAFAGYLARIGAEGEARGVLRVRPHGTEATHYLLYHNVVMHEEGQPPYIISHAHDITGRILAEQATERARAEAEATARARENFLANMSHEIRTPMNGVLGMTSQLAKTPLDPRQQELVRIIDSAGQHLLMVLNDVLDMAKISAGKLELEATPFNLCDSVSDALYPLMTQAQEKGLAVHGVALRASCPLPWVVGDPHRLNQIMLNLVSNAVKFTDQGSISVRSELLAETESHLTVRFSVSDTGPGIAPDKQALMFESFTQEHAATTRQYGGTGLGLSIARALVEQMGGQLTLASTVGQGSTFAFTLVLGRARPAAPARPALAFNTGRLAGTRILLVEDNAINRTVARLILESWQVQLTMAKDGPDALALLAAQDFDLVLMDIQMPGLSGVDVTTRLRRLPHARRAATPVIALTANASPEDFERYRAAGFHDCLTKPYDEATLYGKLAALLPAPLPPPYDLSELQELAQGRAEFITGIIQSFLSNMPDSLAQLRAAGQLGSWAEVARLVHHIKPNLLAMGVAGIEGPMEVLVRKHSRSQAQARVKDSPAALHAALDELLVAAGRAIEALWHELPTGVPGT